ncbi:MAG: Lrp/AsnC family transcriptional regulator [Thermoproteota archaeon]|nr:Lrp/AsnC family transcriptional regulator [Thermoproteota archaeon]
MANNLNSIDEKIIGLLKSDSRKSFVEIANSIGMSESAVRRRVKNLQDTGVIQKFTIDVGPSNKTSAITLISVSSVADTSKVSDQLLKLKGVEIVYEITGQYDIATIIVAPTILEINSYIDEIRKIDGVSDTNTVIILRTLGSLN